MRGLVAALALLLAGPAAAEAGKVVEIIPGSGDPVPIADAERIRYATASIPRARDLLDRELIDYPSARFREVAAIVAPRKLGVTYCGLINSRNSVGGFSGWEPFMLMLTEDHESLRIGSEGIGGELMRMVCDRGERQPGAEDLSDQLTHR